MEQLRARIYKRSQLLDTKHTKCLIKKSKITLRMINVKYTT